MAIEIERRFLVASGGWAARAEPSHSIRQAYLAATPDAAIRIRVIDDASAFLTIKSGKAGIERAEFEYPIPVADAEELIEMRTGAIIEKRRHRFAADGGQWEIDVFGGELDGLVIAEIELETQDRAFDRPEWLGKEITEDGRYSNASLALNGLPEAIAHRSRRP